MPFLVEVTCTSVLFHAKWESFPKERCGKLTHGHPTLRVAVSTWADLFSLGSNLLREYGLL